MSVPEALRFVRALRDDPALRARVEELGDDAMLDQVAAVAAGAGYACSADDLRAAHGRDWGLRWALYAAPRPEP